MLRRVADGVLIHQSEFIQSNAVVVQGSAGVLLIDAGVRGDEMACLAHDLAESGQRVVAGFSTHPHWDHLLWHADLGAAPRYGTARCAGVLVAGDMLSDVMIPMLDVSAADPIEDYLTALALLEGVASDIGIVIPGHGSVGLADRVRARIRQDRAYVHALRDGLDTDDPRVGPLAEDGWEWVAGVHERQLQNLSR